MESLQRLGFSCSEVDEPYDAMLQLCRRPLFYSAIILSLNSLYREELQIISSVKQRFSHVEVWLSDTDGRHAALAEAMRLGADGLIATDGLHRIAASATTVETLEPTQRETAQDAADAAKNADDNTSSDAANAETDEFAGVEESNAAESNADSSEQIDASGMETPTIEATEMETAQAGEHVAHLDEAAMDELPPAARPTDPLLTAEELRALLQDTPGSTVG